MIDKLRDRIEDKQLTPGDDIALQIAELQRRLNLLNAPPEERRVESLRDRISELKQQKSELDERVEALNREAAPLERADQERLAHAKALWGEADRTWRNPDPQFCSMQVRKLNLGLQWSKVSNSLMYAEIELERLLNPAPPPEPAAAPPEAVPDTPEGRAKFAKRKISRHLRAGEMEQS